MPVSQGVLEQIRGYEAQYYGSVVSLVTPQGKYVYISGQVFTNGIPTSEKLGKLLEDYLHPDDVPRAKRAMEEALICDLSVQIRVRVRTEDGYGVIDRMSKRLLDEQSGQNYIINVATKVADPGDL